jgi:hypothetical protein
MSFSELELKRIEKALSAFLAKRRPPAHLRQKLDLGYRLSGHSVELFEIRPQWDDPNIIHEHPFAKATHVKAQNVWNVYWRRADLKWHGYKPVPTVPSIEKFLDVVDADDHARFFG